MKLAIRTAQELHAWGADIEAIDCGVGGQAL